MNKEYTTVTGALRAVTVDSRVIKTKKILIKTPTDNSTSNTDIIEYIGDSVKDTAKLNTNNIFAENNTFTAGISVLPLGTTTIAGQEAYGLSIMPPGKDGKSGGLQLWGIHFSLSDEWSANALKINHNQLGLLGTSAAPTTLSFDNANIIEFKTMPDDGSTTGTTYDFQSWQWTDDSHTNKENTAPVQILKNNAISLNEKSVLNMAESDSRYAQLNSDNRFTANNIFEQEVEIQDDLKVSDGNIIVSNGVLTFEDLVDGTTVECSGASGYQYVQGMPVNFENGVCYDIGTISNSTNLSNIKFTGAGRLVQTCELWFKTPATVPTTHRWPTNIYWIDSATGAAPTLLASKNYRIVFRQEPNKIIASIAYIY